MPHFANLRPLLFLASLLLSPAIGRAQSNRIDFARDVRPILSNHCWTCHGQDEQTRQAKLRLDSREAALSRGESAKFAVIPGKPEQSEVITRINATGDTIMPPPEAKKPLSAAQKETLKLWIEQGAEFSQHWAFVPPKFVVPPLGGKNDVNANTLPQGRTTNLGGVPNNPIDVFVLDRLHREGHTPSPPANHATWLRRVMLDLTGLPPSVSELENFLADDSPAAHEKVVDRLLASPRFAERMAMHWLDAARYADTNGYNNDESRSMWPWRDWVIDAFANGMPYDQFLTEQIAGDLFPDATLAQKVATGFSRNHVLTTEGGIIEEEYHVEYVADRVHTAATVFMGLSLQCARCHDHKYDPLTQRDYYRFAALFNNVPDKVVGYSQGRMAEPLLKVPSREQQAELDLLARRKPELEELLKRREAECDVDLAQWEKSLTPDTIAKLGSVGLITHFPLDEPDGDKVFDASRSTGTIRGKVAREPGKFGGALSFDGNTHVDLGDIGAFEADEKFSLAAWIRPTSNSPTTVLSKMDEAAAHRGYDVILEGAKLASHIVHHWPDKAFKVVTKQAVSLNEWHHVVVTYDGSRKSPGLKIYVDGKLQPLDVTTNNTVDGSLKTDKPFHIGKRHASAAFQGLIDDVQIYSAELLADDVALLASGQPIGGLKDLLAVAPAERSDAQKSQFKKFFLDRIDELSRKLKSELADLPRQQTELDKAIPVTMVMSEQTPRRQTFLLRRGQYDQRGEQVSPGLPAVFVVPPLGGNNADSNSIPPEGGTTSSRLDLARWLTSPSHPLTARVAVNRWWEMFFGTGLVETSEDFGLQGSLPSHPELLDWLATELIRTGWNQRAILKLIVLSGTYRQSSQFGNDSNSPSRLLAPSPSQTDPNNRLLWRGPRYRLSAEGVRDNALAIAGLLRDRLGGPSVKPYQPDGLWEDVSVERREKYVIDPGDGLYRRSMYTFWKRTCPPPSMTTFDAPDREFCLIRRARTNTPLQALVLLNDPTFVEAARVLAARVLAETQTDVDRLTFAYQLVVSRQPSAAERQVLLEVFADAKARFAKDRAATEKFLNVGRSTISATSPEELAAWTTIMSLLLNLDEAISKT